MPTIKLINQQGQAIGDVELAENIFGIEPNTHVMHEAVVNYLANQRQGTFAAKGRGEVRGGGRKPYRQKGTGRARQGSIRAPHYVGGGVSFAKKPRDFSYKLPRKVRRLALCSAFSARVQENALKVVDQLNLEQPKTKGMIDILSAIEAGDKALFILGEKNLNVELSIRNIPHMKLLYVNNINTYQILNHPTVILTKDALDKIQEVYQ